MMRPPGHRQPHEAPLRSEPDERAEAHEDRTGSTCVDGTRPIGLNTTIAGEPSLFSSHDEATRTGSTETASCGGRVGPYRIDRELGRGGMGVVYLATRTDDFQQQVALKVMGGGRRNLEILHRFFRERQILANLQHPHIARLLDGGSTSDTRPYLVMEYVDGDPIDSYCDAHVLSIRQRLRLFVKVCRAAHFAHQNLVVHRDLKPGNILVTAQGDPKLLDFGIAKLLEDNDEGDDEQAQDTLQRLIPCLETTPSSHPMTPAFASPEQVSGGTVTTASDVYSLGVLLYWLTAGQPPYRITERDRESLIRLITHEEPLHPSEAVRLSSVPARIQRRRAKQLTGDLDAIVLKAMRKEPDRRYGSAGQLADDLERHLDGLPVVARDGTWRYHAGKLARRNKPALAVLLMIIAFGITATILWRQAVSARGAAEQATQHAEAETTRALEARTRARSVADFLEDLFTAANPNATRGAAVPVREILDRGRDKIAVSLEDSPGLRADMLGTLGTVYNNLGDLATARTLKQEALALRRKEGPDDLPALAIDLNNLARLHADLGDPAAAEPLLREALEITQGLGDEQRVDVASLNLAGILTHLGRANEALDLHRRVLDRRQTLYGPNDARVASSLFSLGFAQFSTGQLDAAAHHMTRALALYRHNHGDDHTRVASVKGSLGLVRQAQGQHDEARALFESSLEIRQRLLGTKHVAVATVRKNLGALLLEVGDTDAAGQLLAPSLAILRAQRSPGDWTLAQAEGVWGTYLAMMGRTDEAEAILRESLRILTRVKGPHDVFTRDTRRRLERVLDARGSNHGP